MTDRVDSRVLPKWAELKIFITNLLHIHILFALLTLFSFILHMVDILLTCLLSINDECHPLNKDFADISLRLPVDLHWHPQQYWTQPGPRKVVFDLKWLRINI